MYYRLYLFVLLIMSCFCSVSGAGFPHATSYQLFNLNTSKGLSASSVQSVIEGKDGAIWISTKSGIDRYNGQRVQNYTLPQPGNTARTNFMMFRLFCDEQGAMFVYDNKGSLYKYNEVLDAFEILYDLNTIIGQEIILNGVLTDGKDGFYLAFNQGLCYLSSGDSFQWLVRDIAANHIARFGDRLLVGSPEGLYAYTINGEKQEKICDDRDIRSTFFDTQTKLLWIGTFNNGLFVYDSTNQRLCNWPTLRQVPTTPVRSIRALDEHSILVGSDGSGVFVASRDGRDIRLLFDETQGSELQGKGIYDICVDSQKNLWMGSYTGGVDIAIASEGMYETVKHFDKDENSLISNNVNDIKQTSDSSLWYATEGGVSICDLRTRQWHHALKDVAVLNLCETRQGKILAATYGHGVYQVERDGKAIPLYSVESGTLQSNYVFRLMEDSDGSLWVGCLNAPMAQIKDGKATFYPINVVQCITTMPCGDLAVGTAYGWYRLSKTDLKPQQFFTHRDSSSEEYNYSIESILFINDDDVWLGTDGGGIYQYRISSQEVIRHISTKEGLPSDFISSLAYNRYGDILVSTDRGLAVIDRHDFMVNNISYVQDLEANYNHMSIEALQDGRFAYGSSTGVVIVDTERLRNLPYEASLHVTGMEITGIEKEAVSAWKENFSQMLGEGVIRLNYDQNTFDIRFESICYAYQQDIRYQYYLEGFDKEWSPLSDQQTAHFANLTPGKYVFRLRNASQINGRTLDTITLTIVVSQPWWNTWWAWLCYLIIAALFLYFCVRYYLERQKRQDFDHKINLFLHAAHDIRTPLSLILAPIDHIEKDESLSQESRQYLQMARQGCNDLQQMVTRLLDFQKADRKKVQPKFQDLNIMGILEMQVQKFMSLAGKKKISLQLIPVESTVMVSADHAMVDSILDNLLSNAIKYTPEGGSIRVSVESDAERVRIKVCDSGIGIPQTDQKNIFHDFYRARNAIQSRQTGTGLGLVFSRRLAVLQKGNLSFESQEGKGTTFILSLLQGNSAAEDVRSSSEESVNNETLLFVDDSESLRQYIQMAFGQLFHVVTVESAERALEFIREKTCDVLVSDVMMPGMHGDELCRMLKNNPETSWLPVILLSANVDRDSMLGGLEAGADDYVAKPFDEAILRQRIDSLLSNRRRLSKYYLERSLQLVSGAAESESTGIETSSSSGDEENKPLSPQMDAADQEFVEKATRLVLENLSDVDYSIDQLCSDLAMSRTLFYGRIKSLTSHAPQEFVRLIRLERAAALIREGRSIMEVSVETGFINVKYFSTVFKKHFGVSPSKFV